VADVLAVTQISGRSYTRNADEADHLTHAGLVRAASGIADLYTDANSTTISIGGGAANVLTSLASIGQVDITSTGTGSDAIDINSSGGIDIDASGLVSLTTTSVAGIEIVGSFNDFSTGNINITASNASFGSANINLTTTKGDITLSSSGGGTDSINIDSNGGMDIDVLQYNLLTTGAGGIVLNSGTAVDINCQHLFVDATQQISLDCTESSNFTVTNNSGNAQTLTLECTNAGAETGNITITCDDVLGFTALGSSAHPFNETDEINLSGFPDASSTRTITSVLGALNNTNHMLCFVEDLSLTAGTTTDLWAVPTGKIAVVTGCYIIGKIMTAVTVAPDVSFVWAGASTGTAAAQETLTGLSAALEYYRMSPSGVKDAGAATATLRINRDVLATATAMTVDVVVTGYVIDA
jgi:hypothetical protein